MKRDGFNNSLWQNQPDINVSFNSLPATSNVVIAGAGITGLTLGLALQQSGKQCVIAEARSVCFGTTAGTTAHLNTLLDTPYSQIINDFGLEDARMVAALAKRAIDAIEANVKALNIDCGFERAVGYTFAENDKESKIIEDIYKGAKEAGIDVNYVDQIPQAIPFTKSIQVANQAKFNPAIYMAAVAMAFQDAGGIIIENCIVKEVTEKDDAVVVETGVGNITCSRFVWATHTPPGINILSFRLAPYRSYVIAAALENEQEHFDELMYDSMEPYHYYRMQKVDGINYLIAGGEDHKTGHEENTDACFERLETHTRKYFKLKPVAKKWSSQYYEPVDGLPYIGHMPGNTNIFAATGFSGNGMVHSAIASIVLSEIILTGDSTYKKLFSPSRLKPVAGFTDFIKENTDVVKEMVTGWFSAETIPSLADLAQGEGKVIKYENKKMGAFKDESGNLHCVDTTCPHAYCTIGWNNTERSWDCPCHGARYGTDGMVLNGPGVINLQQINPAQPGSDKP